jgi:hypothetical protein
MDDRQLGQRLVTALPDGSALDPEQVLTALRDLLSVDDPRLEPLEAMAQRPEFLALAMPRQANLPTNAQDQEEALLQSLGDSHSPELVARLKEVLAGVRENGASRSPWIMEPIDGKSPESSYAISDKDYNKYLQVLNSASVSSSVSSPAPSDQGGESSGSIPPPPSRDDPPGRPQQMREGLPVWRLVGAIAAAGTLAAMALSALQANRFCTTLGLCSVEVIVAATAALEKAEQTAMRLNKANTIADYEQGTRDLARQVRRIERNGVYSEVQRNSLKSLLKQVNMALARLEREKGERQTSIGVQPIHSNRQNPSMKPAEPLLDSRRVEPRREPINDSRGWKRPNQSPPSARVDQGSDNAPYRKEPLW